ncbi:sigma-E factor regulatory protein RseB [Photobacterium sp. WH77]|uniref:Sigma-E factor regulatory protein RseB n=1 Tax=Photobacterium arenosum TaxID=2774143 RepID=A0ABR9BKA3_9GAMM|nr:MULTISPECIES: sigma-E factor regulatory protein RseB [Photobacterium]MBD8512970.1 sigma-E factor regulatory protein RseB [Photobacterium arenosum]MBV7261904.1 sigma-E factor regulatory protein RseB [Photobacterium sp. WH24]MCG2836703.1 sigma-E factor regulatory protein RseB [Photobacterium sp. WH77]MCG2844170.1 sigma-E factor regulatory protein RseB [Photobacterium sp. WH80]MDO6583350.1 sigma-E factor regulatory protein RseB [Photobacterium sp. 2_MG-2023]
MKKILVGALTLVSLAMPWQASAEEDAMTSAEALLHQMDQATRQLSYEVSYILIKKNSIEPLRYRHAVEDGETFAHLVYLSGPPREVIQRGKEVSYFEPGLDPFTIDSNRMVAPLPPIMRTNVAELAQFYDFIPMGRSREAGTACDVVRIAPKDGARYSYLLWMDTRSHLVLRADLLDRDGEPLEQYRAVSFVVNDKVADILESLKSVKLPEVVQLPPQPQVDLSWQVDWLPLGFESISHNRHRLMLTERPVESQMYTDGLFSFSIYVSAADGFSVREQLVRQGRRTLHSQLLKDKEITVVGDIPPATARRVAESVSFQGVSQP